MGEVTPLPYEILLVDDHPLVRQGIKTIIAEKSELAVVGELQDGLELLDCLNHGSPTWLSWISPCRIWGASKRPG